MSHHLIATKTNEQFLSQAHVFLLKEIQTCIEGRGECILGLSGGSTPRPIYEALGKADLDWDKVRIFLVDERYIDPTSKDSTQKLVRDSLLTHASIPDSNIFFPNTSLPIDVCIQTYANDLQRMTDDHLPDIIILGMGEDGHIASLFPPVPDLALGDEALVIHTKTDVFAVSDRISVSLNFLAAAGKQLFLLQGEKKKNTWEEMMASTEDEKRWPAKRILASGEATIIAQW